MSENRPHLPTEETCLRCLPNDLLEGRERLASQGQVGLTDVKARSARQVDRSEKPVKKDRWPKSRTRDPAQLR